MKPIHVVTVPPQLDLVVLDKVLGAVESTLMELGADHVWVEAEGPALAVMAELPNDPAREARIDQLLAARSC